MKSTVLVLSILLLAGSSPAQSPRPQPKRAAQAEAPKSKFVMTAAPRPAATTSDSGARHNGGNHRSRSSLFYPSSPISLTDDTSGSGGANGYGYSPQSAATAAVDFSASGDSHSPWEPSTYMDYDAALALGKQLQAAAAQPDVSSISLGEVARNYRAAKAKADAAVKPQS